MGDQDLLDARERLEAALIEHRRKHTLLATEMNLARSDACPWRISKLGHN